MQDIGVDFLAAGIGNIHGPYPENWKSLNFETLEKIKKATNAKLPIVLHGGSGIPNDQVKKAISLGVAKINVNTELQIVYAKALKTYFYKNKDQDDKGYDPRKIHNYGMAACKEELISKIQHFGSNNKIN
jgi:fructose-bisphosphate aldolase class II